MEADKNLVGDEIELDEEDERILAEVWAMSLDQLLAERLSRDADPLGLRSDWRQPHLSDNGRNERPDPESVAAMREKRAGEYKGR